MNAKQYLPSPSPFYIIHTYYTTTSHSSYSYSSSSSPFIVLPLYYQNPESETKKQKKRPSDTKYISFLSREFIIFIKFSSHVLVVAALFFFTTQHFFCMDQKNDYPFFFTHSVWNFLYGRYFSFFQKKIIYFTCKLFCISCEIR